MSTNYKQIDPFIATLPKFWFFCQNDSENSLKQAIFGLKQVDSVLKQGDNSLKQAIFRLKHIDSTLKQGDNSVKQTIFGLKQP